MEEFGVASREQLLAKTAVVTALTMNGDLHGANIGLVRTLESDALRLAPLFDFGRSFGGIDSKLAKAVCADSRFAALLVSMHFSILERSWDYSWYDPHALAGFSEELEETLSVCTGMPEGYAQLMRMLFTSQLDYVNGFVSELGRSEVA